MDAPAGCAFHPRCQLASDICRQVQPKLTHNSDGRAVACHFPDRALTAKL
jgi:oligopeptide/dipeptide ABC transporter ATP-binding protein